MTFEAVAEMHLHNTCFAVFLLWQEWPHFSGRFASQSKNALDRREGRVVHTDQSGTIELSYCGGLKAWTFSNATNTNQYGNCDYFIRSSETDSFDIMDVAGGTLRFACCPYLVLR